MRWIRATTINGFALGQVAVILASQETVTVATNDALNKAT